MSEIQSHRDLVVWQKAVDYGLAIYEHTRSFPSDERFGLTSQLRRAAVSIASNIAEGYGRGSTPDYLRFLRVARGSMFEIDTQLTIATRLGFLNAQSRASLETQGSECGRLLAGLIRSIESKLENQ